MQIELQDINLYYENRQVLKDVSVTFPSGKLTVILGPSGCGKTTLLRCICGLIKHHSGNIIVDDKRIKNYISDTYDISMVFQDLAIYESLSVKDNISLSLKSKKVKSSEINNKLYEIAKELDILTILNKKVSQISGGERQRVAIARSLIQNPSLLLMDEPFSNLDVNIKSQIRLTLRHILKKRLTTVILVTHDQDDAFELADQMIVMNQGEIQQQGKGLDIYNKPINLFVATFIGETKINILNTSTSSILSQLYPNSISVCIRPENIQINKKIKECETIHIEGIFIDMITKIPLHNYIFDTPIGIINVLSREIHLCFGEKVDLFLQKEHIIVL